MKWEPHQTYNVDGPERAVPQIAEPPCRKCARWQPKRIYNGIGGFEGVQCCWAEEMFQDFMCFIPRTVPALGVAATQLPGEGASASTAVQLPRPIADAPLEPGTVQCRRCKATGPVLDEFTSPHTGLCAACTRALEVEKLAAAAAASGYETFMWCGQLRYKCNRLWPQSGTPCAYDTYSLEQMDEHIHTIHAEKKQAAPPMPTLFDAAGEQITRERVQRGEREYHFAPEPDTKRR